MALTYDQRLKTFTAWPHRSPSASEMAAAGFIFIGETTMYDNQADAVKCLDCESLLEPWWADYVPFTEHAKWKPDCPFVIAQQQSAALKASNETSKQPSDITSRNANDQSYGSLTLPYSLVKPQTQAKRDAEEIGMLKAKVETLVKQRDLAQMKLAVEKDAHGEDLALSKAKIESARVGAVDALAGKEYLIAAHAVEYPDLNTELEVLKNVIARFQTAIVDKVNHKAAHTTKVRELMIELTTAITLQHTAIESLTASIIQLKVDKVTIHHESSSEVEGLDHQTGVIGDLPNKASIDGSSLFSAEASPTPSDCFEIEDDAEVSEAKMDNAEGDNAKVDDAEVYANNQDDSSASNADAVGADAWGTIPNEDDSNNGAGATDNSLSGRALGSDDSWFDLESIAPSSDSPDGDGSG